VRYNLLQGVARLVGRLSYPAVTWKAFVARRQLSQQTVDRLSPDPKRTIERPDHLWPALRLVVQPTGSRSFAVRTRIHGRTVKITLDKRAIGTDLVKARDAARDLLAKIAAGRDPRAERTERKERGTVAEVTADYVERHLKRNTRRWRDAEQMLKRDVLPQWGTRPMASITRRDVLDLVDGVLDRGSPVSANRVLSRIKALFNWAIARSVVEHNPAFGIKEPHREQPREKTLSEAELRAIWGAFNAMGHPFGPLCKLLLLTAQRRGEVAAMRWDQLDFSDAVWRLEASDTKAARAHIVPLAPVAVELLRHLPRVDHSPLVFPSERLASDRPVSGFSKALRTAQRISGVAAWTFHDLRRSVATGLARLGVAPHVTEKILNHSGGHSLSQLARVYNTYSYGKECRQALELWAAELERIVSGRR
jgi:integrase